MKPKEVIELAAKNDVKFVDLKFIDFPGTWQHTTLGWRLNSEAFVAITCTGSALCTPNTTPTP